MTGKGARSCLGGAGRGGIVRFSGFGCLHPGADFLGDALDVTAGGGGFVHAYATLFFDVLDRKNEPWYIQVAVETALTRPFWLYDASNVNEADKCRLGWRGARCW